MLNTSKCYDADTDRIPINFYVVRNDLFVPCAYRIASVDVERIGVNDMVTSGTSTETDQKEKDGIRHAVETMKRKVDVLLAYLKAVQAGTIAADPAILASVAQICSSIPVSNNDIFRAEFAQETNDAKLNILLMQMIETATVVKTSTFHYAALQQKHLAAVRNETEQYRRSEQRHQQRDARGAGRGMPMSAWGMPLAGGWVAPIDDDEFD